MDRLFSLSPKELYESTLDANYDVITKISENDELMRRWWQGRFEYNLNTPRNPTTKDPEFDVYELFPQQIIRKRNNFPDSVR